MAHGPSMGSLVLPHEARRGGMALPLSLTVHAAFIGAVLMVPRAARVEVPEVFRRPILNLPVPEAQPIRVAVTPPPAVRTTRPGPVRAPADPAPPAPAVVGHVAIPLDVPDTIPVADTGGACVGCVLGGPPTEPVDGGGTAPEGTGSGPAAGSAPRPIGGQITAPVKLRNVDPDYPALARQAGVQGTVLIECVIDTEGRVVQSRVLQGPPLLSRAALDAVNQWRYRPTLLNGAPISVIMTVRLEFHLR